MATAKTVGDAIREYAEKFSINGLTPVQPVPPAPPTPHHHTGSSATDVLLRRTAEAQATIQAEIAKARAQVQQSRVQKLNDMYDAYRYGLPISQKTLTDLVMETYNESRVMPVIPADQITDLSQIKPTHIDQFADNPDCVPDVVRAYYNGGMYPDLYALASTPHTRVLIEARADTGTSLHGRVLGYICADCNRTVRVSKKSLPMNREIASATMNSLCGCQLEYADTHRVIQTVKTPMSVLKKQNESLYNDLLGKNHDFFAVKTWLAA